MENDLSPFDWAFARDKWPLFKVVLVLKARDTTAVHNAIQNICNGHIQVSDVSVVSKEENETEGNG